MRNPVKAILAALLCVTLDAAAQGVDEAGLSSMPCPDALEWIHAHPESSFEAMQQRDSARTFTEPALRAELIERFTKDQKARRHWLANRSNRQAQRAVVAVDEDDIEWLYGVVTTKGFPTAAQIGELGVHNVWLLAQHADRAPKFQAELLAAFEQRHAEGELSGSDLSRFTDRVLVAQGKPQRYGTQFTPEQWARPDFGLPDDGAVRQVDANRRALGVMPLAAYVCMMSYARKSAP